VNALPRITIRLLNGLKACATTPDWRDSRADFGVEHPPLTHDRSGVRFAGAHLVGALEGRDWSAPGQASLVDAADQPRLATERPCTVSTDTPASPAMATIVAAA
jgi:hypothetical protein